MKVFLFIYSAFVAFASVLALSLRELAEDAPAAPIFERVPVQELWKRRGGGGSGGRGGGSSGGGSSGGGSSGGGSSGGGSSGGGSSGGSSSGGTRGGSSGGSSSGGRGSTSSASGGRTKTGSGVRPAYGGGSYYGGGASVPYRSGLASPSGLTPLFLGAGIGLAFWPGIWLNGAYLYHYSHPYSYHNSSNNMNETKPVICACGTYEECGCDDNTNSTYMNSVLGNGSYSGLNQSLVTVADVNSTSTILINGTLPNGTTADGGTEDANAGAGLRSLLNAAGWWPAVATVVAMVFTL